MAEAMSVSPSISLSTLPLFVSEPDEKYYCIHENHILQPPILQLICGHRMCTGCRDSLANGRSAESVTCPGGEEDCSEATLDQIFPDVGTTRELRRMRVYCPNRASGCQAQMAWSQLEEHIKNCGFTRHQCPNEGCEELILQSEMQQHINNHCKFAKTLCVFCNELVPNIDMVNGHRDRCQLRERACLMSEFGCTFSASANEIVGHENDFKLHMGILVNTLRGLNHKVGDLSEKVDYFQNENQQLQQTNAHLVSENAKIKDSLAPRLERLEKKIAECYQHSLTQESKFTENLQNLTTKQGANNDVLMIHEGRLTTFEQNAGSSGDVERLERSISNFETKFASNDLRIKCLETTSYDGVLLWKISSYSSRRRDAVEGRTLSLYSQPFYSSRYGYKMCARIYLNGDGMGKNSHISMFFVVMRGEFDALLQWPFRQKVTLSLMDQQSGDKHITEIFRTDPTSTSFRMPVGEMNIASGCPMFAKQEVVNTDTYLKQDTLFIKVQVTDDKY